MQSKFVITSAFLLFCVLLQCNYGVAYKAEIEITPAPPEEVTTKKSGFFGGFKNFFRGSATTTTTELPPIAIPTSPKSPPPQQQAPQQQQPGDKPPPLVIPRAPLMPLGPRPDTPPSSPIAGSPQQPPQWPQPAQGPQSSPTTPTATPIRPQQGVSQQYPSSNPIPSRPNSGPSNLPPGFPSYHSPKPLPSGLDLSYGGGRPQMGGGQSGGRPGFGLAPLTSTSTSTSTTTSTSTSTSTTTTTTPRSAGIRPKEDFPPLPPPRRPSIKEDFPALPTPRTPPGTPTQPPTPTGPRPSSPSAWGTPTTPHQLPQRPSSPPTQPHPPSSLGTTTVRPGVASSGSSLATDDEIRALTENLYTKEVNSQLNMIRVSPQGKTRSIDSTDEAPQPLLDVNEKALESPTIAKMRLLFNNYETDTMTNEHVTPNERLEENDFVDAVMATSVMRQAMQFLQNKGIVSPDPKTHRDLVKELWFTQYSRGKGKIGSSGFEHVFVNEVKEGTIIGLHNWVYFYEEEKAGRLDYKGYLNQLDLGTKAKVVKARFSHNGLNKPVNTLFVGTSPELELALYTVCFQLRPDRTCPVSLGNSKFGIVTYSWRYRGKNLIGSAFPEI